MSEIAKELELFFKSMTQKEKALAVVLVAGYLDGWRQNRASTLKTLTEQQGLLALLLKAALGGDFVKDVEDGLSNVRYELLASMKKNVDSVVS